MNRASFLGQPFFLVAGFSIWAVGFLALYALLSVGCAYGWNEIAVVGPFSLLRLQLVAVFVVSLAACAGVVAALAARRRGGGKASESFLAILALQASIAALVATFFTFAGVLTLSICD